MPNARMAGFNFSIGLINFDLLTEPLRRVSNCALIADLTKVSTVLRSSVGAPIGCLSATWLLCSAGLALCCGLSQCTTEAATSASFELRRPPSSPNLFVCKLQRDLIRVCADHCLAFNYVRRDLVNEGFLLLIDGSSFQTGHAEHLVSTTTTFAPSFNTEHRCEKGLYETQLHRIEIIGSDYRLHHANHGGLLIHGKFGRICLARYRCALAVM